MDCVRRTRNGGLFSIARLMGVGALCVVPARVASAQRFPGYRYAYSFTLPTGAGPFDILNDGRVITLVGAKVYVETRPGSHGFTQTRTLPAADFPSFGAAFIRVSPDETQIAVGNNGGTSFSHYQVGVFDVDSLMGAWLAANHLDAEWIDNAHIALTAGDFGSPSAVTVLDTASPNPLSPTNITIIDNIGGASGGIAFDSAGNLYTGNGFQTSGPSGTGAVKAFPHAAWTAALKGGPPLDFEEGGVLVVDVLSASPLAFDRQGDLLVGGGDFSSSTDTDFVALVRASAVANALSGMGPVDSSNPDQVRRLDPDAANDFNYFSVNYDSTLGRLYVRDSGSATVHTYMDVSTIPTHPFAVRVLEFAPAPGQFVNHPDFNDPARGLGPPSGGGTSAPNNTSVVSLGGFGGYIVLGFDHTVVDDPLNPFGMDAIVFGNAYWVGDDPQRHWAECATIEISLDVNGNGLADDPWYLIPGSHITDASDQLAIEHWDDDVNDDRFPPDDESWIPPGYSGAWDTQAFALPVATFGAPVVTNPDSGGHSEGIFGYADYSPTLVLGDLNGDNVVDDPEITAEEFYMRPDDPRTVGVTRGSGGGDAFDIAWAIDPLTGDPAGLWGFDFIRLTSAVDSVSPIFGEKSAEIDAVADVAPDPFGDADDDGDIDLTDVAKLLNCFGDDSGLTPACERVDREPHGTVGLEDAAAFVGRMTGPL